MGLRDKFLFSSNKENIASLIFDKELIIFELLGHFFANGCISECHLIYIFLHLLLVFIISSSKNNHPHRIRIII